MTTPFYSPSCKDGSGVQPRAHLGFGTVSDFYTLGTYVLENDVFHIVKVPAGATVLDVILECFDFDADVSPTMTFSVGYTGALKAFIDESVVPQAGGVARLSVPGGSQKHFAAADTIQISCTTGAATNGLGGYALRLTALYTMDP